MTPDEYEDMLLRLRNIEESQARVEEIVSKIADEVKPTLDMLLANPAIRMFLGTKKAKKE